MNTCTCNHEETGRCWLRVDAIIFEQNIKRLQVKDALAVYTFALLESKRLQQKLYDMNRNHIAEITPDFCCLGTRFETESERSQRVIQIASER